MKTNQDVKQEHVLAVVASETFNTELQQKDYDIKIKVSEEILQFMNNHDTKISSLGEKIFIYNKLEYIYLGAYQEPSKEDVVENEIK